MSYKDNIIKGVGQNKLLFLGNKKLTVDDAKFLAQTLRGIQIIRLYLGNNFLRNEGMKYLSEALNFSRMVHLDLSQNDIGDEGAKYLAEALKNNRVLNLNLSGNRISDDGVKYIAQVLEYTQITNLNLDGNHMGIDGAQKINEVLDRSKISRLKMRIHSTKNYGFQYISYESFSDAKKITISFASNNIGANCAKYINKTFQNIPIFELKLASSLSEVDDVKYLAEAFKNIEIAKLSQIPVITDDNIEYFIEAFKNSRIAKMDLSRKTKILRNTNLAKFLKEVKIIDLNLSNRYLVDEEIEILAPSLKNNSILNLDLSENKIFVKGAKHLANVLRHTQITQLDLSDNDIGHEGAKYLADGLIHSQVRFLNLNGNMIEYTGYQYLKNIVKDTFVKRVIVQYYIETRLRRLRFTDYRFPIPENSYTTLPDKIISLFESIVLLNPSTDRFEFTLNKKNSSFKSMEQYLFLIKTLNKNPILKVHIFDEFCRRERDYFDLIMMKKIDNFIGSLAYMFNTFFNSELLSLMELAPDLDYVNLVEQFENSNLYDIVCNLLSHRELYYVDENREILHPYIYKLLHKHNMTLCHEQIEPCKKKKIISYYEDHSEIDGAREVIELLRLMSFENKI